MSRAATRGLQSVRLPDGARLLSDRLRDAGYFTANVLQHAPGARGQGKLRRQRTAVFRAGEFPDDARVAAVVELRTQKLLIDPASLELPLYRADHSVVRIESASCLDFMNLLDEKAEVLENTAAVFMGDNGR